MRAKPRSVHRTSGHRAPAILLVGALLAACADDVSASGGDGTASTTGSSSGTAIATSGSTSAMEGCWRHVDGDLDVVDGSNLEELGEVVSVTGVLQVALMENAQADLSFLGCLESVGTLFITGNVRSTAGMHRLSTLGSVVVYAPSALEAIEGLEGVSEIGTVIVDQSTVARYDLPSLRRLDELHIGGCIMGQVTNPPGPLKSLAGFDSLEYMEWLDVAQSPSLTDAAILDALIANHAPPLEQATFRDNASLPSAEVVAKLDVLGAEFSSFCGNLGEEPCMCDGPD